MINFFVRNKQIQKNVFKGKIAHICDHRTTEMFSLQNNHGCIKPTVFIILTLIVTAESLVTLNYLKDIIRQFVEEPKDAVNLKSSYDYIVVGAGTAGCTVANRLSEDPSSTVLLVEAGGHEFFFMDIPLLGSMLQLTIANWNYNTEPSNKYCTGFIHKQCKFPRGKVLGGSSVLNDVVYTRGAPQDYDNWKAMGNDGWSWEDVLPYFKKVENVSIDEFIDPYYHSQDGHVSIEYSPYRTKKSSAWVQAAEEYGFQYGDYNGPTPAGVVSFLQLSLKNGTRHSASRAYLHPIRNRKNFFLSKWSLVTKLLVNPTKTAVIGIEFIKMGSKYRMYAKKEVILAAGAINSPQLLMLSGIGPREHLNYLGIPLVKDLPVGYNLMDHIATGGLLFTVSNPVNILSLNYIFTHYQSAILPYMNDHRGPLTLGSGAEALLFTELNDQFNTTAWPDMELIILSNGVTADPTLKKSVNFQPEIFEQVYGPAEKVNNFMVYPILLRPKSKGRITLRNRDPMSAPIIVPNYFDFQEDIYTIIRGIRLSIELLEQPALKAIGAKLYDVPIKRCLEDGPFGSDEYFSCMTHMFTFTIYHQCGTCKMGPKYDQTSVVDQELKVHGLSNIRVVDASVIPEIISAHINAAVYMIAEKAADIIKNHWKINKKIKIVS